MDESIFAQIEVPRPFRLRLRAALRALRGKDAIFDGGASFSYEGQRFTLAKLAVAQWIETDDQAEAHQTLALKLEESCGRVDWDGRLEPEVAALRGKADE